MKDFILNLSAKSRVLKVDGSTSIACAHIKTQESTGTASNSSKRSHNTPNVREVVSWVVVVEPLDRLEIALTSQITEGVGSGEFQPELDTMSRSPPVAQLSVETGRETLWASPCLIHHLMN